MIAFQFYSFFESVTSFINSNSHLLKKGIFISRNWQVILKKLK